MKKRLVENQYLKLAALLGPCICVMADHLGVLVGILVVGAGAVPDSLAYMWDPFPPPGSPCPALM